MGMGDEWLGEVDVEKTRAGGDAGDSLARDVRGMRVHKYGSTYGTARKDTR